jgi:hypothetical protein
MNYKITYNMEHVVKYSDERWNKSKEFFLHNDINKFLIKDWKNEIGKKFHPLLESSPLLVTNMWRKEFLELDDEIQELFKKENNKQFYKNEEKEHMKDFLFPENELGQKIMSIMGKDLDLINNEFLTISLLENQVGIMDRPAEDWHTDSQMKQTVRIIVYLSDVDDELDGPFQYIARPEEKHFNIDDFHNFNVDPEAGMEMYSYVNSLPEEKKVKMYGKKYTAVIFDPMCLHRGSNPIRKPRRIMLIDIKRKNNIATLK